MRTPAQIAGHPIHPMLVTVPIGLWLFSFACDLIATRVDDPSTWTTVSLYCMVGGAIGAAAAAVPGIVDFLSLRNSPTRRTALAHMILNVTVLTLFVLNAFLRGQQAVDHGTSLAISAVAILLLGVSGWLGGKMVYVEGVAVHAGEEEARTTAPRASAAGAARPHPPAGSAWRPSPDRAMASDRTGPDSDRTSNRDRH
jgi:uncharacterized membrane protein